MAGPQFLVRLLAEQRKRCVATILSSAENSTWWTTLSNTQQATFREQVSGAVRVYYDFTRDVAKVTEEDGTRNEMALELLRSLHRDHRQLTASLNEHLRRDTNPRTDAVAEGAVS